MSDQPEVTPLRLKRPGAASAPPPATPAPPSPTIPPMPAPDAGSPLMPLPGQPQPGATIPPSPPAADAPAPERIRRRPSLAPESSAATTPPGGHSATIPPTPHVGEAPPAESPVVPLPFAGSMSAQPTQPPIPAIDTAGPGTAPPSAPAGAGFKLKIGVKAPPPPPPPTGGQTLGAPPPLAPLPGDLVGAPPLMPLPGLPPVGGGAAFPPPSTMPGAAPPPPLAPLPPLPSMPETPAMTAGVPGAAAGSGTRPPIHLRTDAPVDALDPSRLPPPLPAARARAAVAGVGSARRDAVIFGLVFLVIAGVGGGAWLYFSRPDEVADAKEEVLGKLEEAAKLPGKAVDNAKGTIDGAREKEQARIDAVAEGREVPDDRAVGVSPGELESRLKEANTSPAAEPFPPVQMETPSVTTYAGEKPQAPVTPPPPQATTRFVRYAEALRVSGVFQGSPARALVDGRLVRSGDVIEPNLGVSFVGVDAETKHLILQDKSGAQVRVKY